MSLSFLLFLSQTLSFSSRPLGSRDDFSLSRSPSLLLRRSLAPSTVVCSGNHPLRRSVGVFSDGAKCYAARGTESRKAGRLTETVWCPVLGTRTRASYDDRRRRRRVLRENDSGERRERKGTRFSSSIGIVLRLLRAARHRVAPLACLRDASSSRVSKNPQ